MWIVKHNAHKFSMSGTAKCISVGVVTFHANTERFQGLVLLLLPTECPKGGGGGMWGIFGKPLKRATWNTLGLHAVLTTCLRISSVLDGMFAACCLFLSTGSYHVCIQIHTTCCCFPRCTTR